MLALTGVLAVMPIPDVDDVEVVARCTSGPVHQLCKRTTGWIGPQESRRLVTAYMEAIRMRFMGRNGPHKISLHALRNQD